MGEAKNNPSQSRERGMFETDEQYAERMKHLDWCDDFWSKVTNRKDALNPPDITKEK